MVEVLLVCLCRSGPAGLKHHQFGFRSKDKPQNQSLVDLSVYLLNDKHQLCLWVWSSINIFAVSRTLDRVCLNFAVDPVDVMGDTGVDSRLILLPAPIAPADHTHQSHLVIVSTDERAAGVSLWVKVKKQN